MEYFTVAPRIIEGYLEDAKNNASHMEVLIQRVGIAPLSFACSCALFVHELWPMITCTDDDDGEMRVIQRYVFLTWYTGFQGCLVQRWNLACDSVNMVPALWV